MSFGGGSKCWIFNDDIEVNFWGIKRGILMVPNLFFPLRNLKFYLKTNLYFFRKRSLDHTIGMNQFWIFHFCIVRVKRL